MPVHFACLQPSANSAPYPHILTSINLVLADALPIGIRACFMVNKGHFVTQ